MRQDVTLSKVKHPRYSYRVRYPGQDGKTVQKWFTTKTEAGLFAKEREKEIGREGLAFGVMGDDEKAAVAFWRGFVASMPDAPPPALLAVLQDYSTQWRASRSSITVAAAVDTYEASKKAEGLRAASLQAIRARCHRFVMNFGERSIATLTTAEISDWILSLPVLVQRGPVKPKASKSTAPPQVGLLAKRNHRLALSGLFAFAKTRGWVRDNPVTDAARPKPPKTRPGILRPADVARLFGALEKAAPDLVPFWAVRFFAGVREQECLRMDWSMIDLPGRDLHLHDTVTKTGHSRTVKVEPALAAFLTPYAKSTGLIVTPSAMARVYHLKKAMRILQAEDEAAKDVAKEIGGEALRPFPVPMPANAARHSFATFHLLAFRHAGETALQLGHGGSPEMLHRHYKGIASEQEAVAFWAIRPAAGAANVIPMEAQTVADSTKSKKERKAR